MGGMGWKKGYVLALLVAGGLWVGVVGTGWAEGVAVAVPAPAVVPAQEHAHGAMMSPPAAAKDGAAGQEAMPHGKVVPGGWGPGYGGGWGPGHGGGWGPGYGGGWGPGYGGGWGPGYPGSMVPTHWQNGVPGRGAPGWPMASGWGMGPGAPGWGARGGEPSAAAPAVGVAPGSFDHTQQHGNVNQPGSGKKCKICIDKNAAGDQTPCARCAQCKKCQQGGGASGEAAAPCKLCNHAQHKAGMGCTKCRSAGMGTRMMDPLLLGHAPAVVEQTLQFIWGLLVVTAEQDVAWKGYAEAALALAAAHGERREGMMAPVDSALALAERRTQWATQMVAKRQKALEGFTALFNQLQDDQKGRLNGFFLGIMP